MVGDTRERYIATLQRAMRTPLGRGGADPALHAFLTLHAGYFLGEWLPEATHALLVRQLSERLDGLADLQLPADTERAVQLGQHVRELTAEIGASPWLKRLAEQTAS